jgi:hypothetical protein
MYNGMVFQNNSALKLWSRFEVILESKPKVSAMGRYVEQSFHR